MRKKNKKFLAKLLVTMLAAVEILSLGACASDEEQSGQEILSSSEVSTEGVLQEESKSLEDISDTVTESTKVTEEPSEEADVTPEESEKESVKEEVKEESPGVELEKTYSFNDLTQTLCWSAEVTANSDGSTHFAFPKQYNQLSFLIPDDVDKTRLEKVICNTSDDMSGLSVKFYGDEGMQSERAVVYGNNQLQVGDLAASDLVCVGIMGLQDGYEITLDSITFVMNDGKLREDDNMVEKKYYKKANENNPIVTQRYSADPGVMVYNDTVYIYATNDIYEFADGEVIENTYGKIRTLNCFSSKDLVNWTDHGAIPVAGSAGAAKWANNSWAPCAAHKVIDGKDKFFLYFANSGGGIGVLTADSPEGPWTDPLGKALISRNTPTCDTVLWLFDPAVLVDDDGTGYLYFGGGVPNGKEANPQTARVVQLGDDMISLAGDPVMIEPPYLFEDSGINKINGKYYYSYCSNWSTQGSEYATAAIEYMVSDNPMGPFVYTGEMFKNPGVYFGVWGNNHHSMFELNGQLYLAYHARALETGKLGYNKGYRSTQIDKVTLTDEGMLELKKPTMAGPEQLMAFDPYQTVPAECMARECGIEVIGCGDTHVKAQAGDWTGLKRVDFKDGVSKMTLSVKADAETTIEIRTGNFDGTLIGTVQVPATGEAFTEVTVNVENVTGEVELFFVYGGDVAFDYWKAEK